jgi:hypothetical protein
MSSISSVMNVHDKGSTANSIIANHVLELSLELAHGLEAAPQDICVILREIVRVPLRKQGPSASVALSITECRPTEHPRHIDAPSLPLPPKSAAPPPSVGCPSLSVNRPRD